MSSARSYLNVYTPEAMAKTLALCDEQIERLEAENAKLRKLVRDMWFWGYEGHMDSESQEWQMKHIDGVLDRMHELGIEVNDA